MEEAMYTEFINGILNCIFNIIGDAKNKLRIFAENSRNDQYSSLQDNAVLREEDASLFIDIIHENRDIFDINENDYQIQKSLFLPNRVRYSHSCYPKNIRRWQKGTLSRKKKCRIEFIVLTVCWAIGWKRDLDMQEKYVECRKSIVAICEEILENNIIKSKDMYTIRELLWILWETSQFVYERSYKK